MRSLLLRFLRKLIIVSLIMVLLSVIAFLTFLKSHYFTFYPLLLVLIPGFTFLTYAFLIKRANLNFGKFIRATMIITILRLVVYVAITVLYAVVIKHRLTEFVIALGICYLVFTSLEVYELIMWSLKTRPADKKI